MNANLRLRIELVRDFLAGDPQGVMYGMIGPPFDGASRFAVNKVYAEFLSFCDGARFGAGVYLWDHETLERSRPSIRYSEINLDEWTPIGEYGDDTLAMRAESSIIARFFREGDGSFQIIGEFEDFLDSIFSQGYLSMDVCLGETMDSWIWALRRTNLC